MSPALNSTGAVVARLKPALGVYGVPETQIAITVTDLATCWSSKPGATPGRREVPSYKAAAIAANVFSGKRLCGIIRLSFMSDAKKPGSEFGRPGSLPRGRAA
jgi:hypothetical protein